MITSWYIFGRPYDTVFLIVLQMRRPSLRSSDLSKVTKLIPRNMKLSPEPRSFKSHTCAFCSVLCYLCVGFFFSNIFLGRTKRPVKFYVSSQFKENLFIGL